MPKGVAEVRFRALFAGVIIRRSAAPSQRAAMLRR
jgi:hypothetical protein